MQLPIQAQSRLFAEDWEAGAGTEEIVRIARTADERGFFYLGVCDHVVIPRELAGAMGTIWYDTVATLGMLAGVTKRVRLLSHVSILAYRHPLVSANAFATLDALSGGRVIVGVGVGHVADEFATLGVDFADRAKILDEAIDVLAAALADEFPTHQGPRWSIRDMGLGPRPVQRPRPPIWVGGSSKAALRRAAAKGDGWLPQGTPRVKMPEQISYLLSERRRLRGDVPLEIGTICEPVHVGTPSWDVGKSTISGKPESIAASLLEFVGMGVCHLQVRFRSRCCDELIDQMEAFAAEVAPCLTSPPPG